MGAAVLAGKRPQQNTAVQGGAELTKGTKMHLPPLATGSKHYARKLLLQTK